MNVNNLKQVWMLDNDKDFKYIEMCNLMEQQEKCRGKSRDYQFIDWKRYFDFYKFNPKGQKYRIKEFYLVVKDKIDNRKGNSGTSEGSRNNYKGVYLEYAIPLLLQCLSNYKENYSILTTTNQLAERIHIVNHNYSTANNNRNKYNQYMYEFNKFTNYTAKRDVFDSLYEIIKPIIVGALNNLEKNNNINYHQTYIIYYVEIVEETVIHDMRESNIEESAIIREIEEQTLLSMGIENVIALQHNNKLRNDYYKKVEKLVKEQIEMEFYCTGYKINVIDEVKGLDNIKELQLHMNETVLSKAINKITKKKNKILTSENKFFKGSIKGSRTKVVLEKWDKDRLNVNYMIEAEEMVKSLVVRNYRDIGADIEQTKVKRYIKYEDVDFNVMTQNDIRELAKNAIDEETREIMEVYFIKDLPF